MTTLHVLVLVSLGVASLLIVAAILHDIIASIKEKGSVVQSITGRGWTVGALLWALLVDPEWPEREGET